MKAKPVLGVVLVICLLASSISCDWLRSSVISNHQDFEYITRVTSRYYVNEEYYDVINLWITGYNGPGGDIAIPDTINGIVVTGINEYAFRDCSNITSIMIPTSIEWIDIGVFSGCTSLTDIRVEVPNGYLRDIDGVLFAQGGKQLVCYPASKTGSSYTIPSFVRSINYDAFNGCSNLTSIIVDEANYYFKFIDGVLFSKDGTELISYPAGKTGSSYTIPSSVVRISNWAFWGCTSLASITIPDRVRMIGYESYSVDMVFSDCTSLTEIIVDASNPIFKDVDGVLYTKDGTSLICYPAGKIGSSYTIPNGVEKIIKNAFSNCANLTSITIPSSVEQIGEKAFSGCTILSEIIVDASNPIYTGIDGVLFHYRPWSGTSLICYPVGKTNSSYTVPLGVSRLERWAFEDCTSLTSIRILYCDRLFNWEALSYCASLTEIKVGASEYGHIIDIDGVLFSSYGEILSLYPAGKTGSSYTIPDSVTIIRDGAFRNSSNLTNITIPDSVSRIWNEAFRNCTNLTSITIPSSVEQIAWDAFWGCRNLTIICPRDSYAHTYCIRTGLNFQLMP